LDKLCENDEPRDHIGNQCDSLLQKIEAAPKSKWKMRARVGEKKRGMGPLWNTKKFSGHVGIPTSQVKNESFRICFKNLAFLVLPVGAGSKLQRSAV
jgi:hypothetical protein